jgi:hypothetical protein
MLVDVRERRLSLHRRRWRSQQLELDRWSLKSRLFEALAPLWREAVLPLNFPTDRCASQLVRCEALVAKRLQILRWIEVKLNGCSRCVASAVAWRDARSLL